jgi:hypothetical protein
MDNEINILKKVLKEINNTIKGTDLYEKLSETSLFYLSNLNFDNGNTIKENKNINDNICVNSNDDNKIILLKDIENKTDK